MSASTYGIPTTYAGTRYRSLVEAKWARFFELLGWPFEYEPFELNGYIPDFVLTFPEPVLVEVKSELCFEALFDYRSKIEASGWDGHALIVGARLFQGPYSLGASYMSTEEEKIYRDTLGVIRFAGDDYWQSAKFVRSTLCQASAFESPSEYESLLYPFATVSLSNHDFSGVCLRSGQRVAPDSDELSSALGLQFVWQEGCNDVQWKGR